MPRKRFGRNRKNRCRFCTPEGCPRPAYVDYKDVGLLKKLCTKPKKPWSPTAMWKRSLSPPRNLLRKWIAFRLA